MTEQELKQSLNIVSTNYNRRLDENIVVLWRALFINFDAIFFKKACLKVITSNKYFPNASEIIDAYQYVRQEAECARFEKLKDSQKLLSANQAYCYLCDNDGFCSYVKTGYQYVARCICSHGQDLNKFSECQVNRERKPELKEYYPEHAKAAIKHGDNPFYFPTIKEVLKDDFAIFDARRKERYLSRNTFDDAQKAEILKSIGALGHSVPDGVL